VSQPSLGGFLDITMPQQTHLLHPLKSVQHSGGLGAQLAHAAAVTLIDWRQLLQLRLAQIDSQLQAF
jgi:hypothetical protein